MPGRNDPCPCGSGQKYKKCCLEKRRLPLRGTHGRHAPFTPAERASAIEKLFRFASNSKFQRDREKGLILFWGGRLDTRSDEEIRQVTELESTEINFNTWFLFDMELEDGKTVADLFLARERDHLEPTEREYLERASRTHFRLYEIEDVTVDQGFRLRDLWTDELHDVEERAATHYFVRWDLMATRLMNLTDDHSVIDAGICNYPPEAKNAILTALQHRSKRFRRDSPDLDETAFFKRIGFLFNHWWLDWVAFRPFPKVVTAEGHNMIITRLRFDLKDPPTVKAALDGHPEFEAQGKDAYAWMEQTPEACRGLGAVRIKPRHLVLETMSKERGERGRELLEQLVGDAVAYRLTEYQNVKQALQQQKAEMEESQPSGLPPEIEAKLKRQFLEDHYRKWLDDEIPALSGKTPRRAVKLKTFRHKVIDLLKAMENRERRAAREGGAPYDFGWLWEELGLKRETEAT